MNGTAPSLDHLHHLLFVAIIIRFVLMIMELLSTRKDFSIENSDLQQRNSFSTLKLSKFGSYCYFLNHETAI